MTETVWNDTPAVRLLPGALSMAGRFIRRNPIAALALVGAIALVLLAVLAPAIAPFDPAQQKLLFRLKAPSVRPDYLLGTDQLGRDILSRALYGLRLTLALSLTGAVIGLALGTAIGLVSGLVGGLIDDALTAIVDLMISVPFVLVALLVLALAGNSTGILIFVLGLAYWAHFARLVRSQVVAMRDLPYVEAARAAGAGPLRVALRHLLPNMVSPVLVMFTLTVSNLILLESSLSFLGIGVQPPTATLGSMVGDGRDYMESAPWLVAAPGGLIVAVTLVVMLLGDALRDAFDVKLRTR
jgi:peptide/nickel transport system permease protein